MTKILQNYKTMKNGENQRKTKEIKDNNANLAKIKIE